MYPFATETTVYSLLSIGNRAWCVENDQSLNPGWTVAYSFGFPGDTCGPPWVTNRGPRAPQGSQNCVKIETTSDQT